MMMIHDAKIHNYVQDSTTSLQVVAGHETLGLMHNHNIYNTMTMNPVLIPENPVHTHNTYFLMTHFNRILSAVPILCLDVALWNFCNL
jgi:hypothetical protein